MAEVDYEPAPQQEAAICQAVVKRCEHWPLQYLTGRQEFMSLEFQVNPDVLIPRADTETVVETALEIARKHPVRTVVDVGTGSGVIAVSLARYFPEDQKTVFYATEISPQALETARKNARSHEVEINFLHADLLSPFRRGGRYEETPLDMVISNPPYISSAEFSSGQLPPELLFEPPQALYGGLDGLEVYRRLIPQSREVLSPCGFLIMEIGWKQTQAVFHLLDRFGFTDLKVLKDPGGRDRVIVAHSDSCLKHAE